MPRMFVGADQRDLSVELFGLTLPSPLFMAPVGVIGLCCPGRPRRPRDGAGGGAHRRADGRLDPDRRPDGGGGGRVRRHPGLLPALHPDRPRAGREPGRRAEAAGFKGIVVTLDTWITGWRPRDLAVSNFPQLRGHCLANYFTDPVFRARSARTPEDDPAAAILTLGAALRQPAHLGRPAVAALAHHAAADRQGHLPPRRRPPRHRRRGGRHLLLQPRRPPGQRRAARPGRAARRGRRRRRHARCCSTPASAPAPTSIKALALGATAVGIGRPYAYGLALGGTDGIVHVLRSILAEADLIMAVDGYPTLADLTPDALRPVR